LSGGRLAQVGTPEELYRAPADRFVAGFVGRASFVPATVDATGRTASGPGLPGGSAALAQPAPPGTRGELMLRPEQLRLTEAGRPGALAGEVAATRFGGAVSWVVVRVEGAELEVQVTGDRPAIGERVA